MDGWDFYLFIYIAVITFHNNMNFISVISFYKERAILIDRNRLPRSVGYRQLEAGLAHSEGSTATTADLLAAAAAVSRAPIPGHSLFSLDSDESLASPSAGVKKKDGQAEDTASADRYPKYVSFEMRPIKRTARFGHPAILSVGTSETVNL
jgi:hypothetical protein